MRVANIYLSAAPSSMSVSISISGGSGVRVQGNQQVQHQQLRPA